MSTNDEEYCNRDPWFDTNTANNTKLEFEDTFVAPKADIVPLDDSLSYIAGLERKLNRLKNGKNRKQDLLQAAQTTCDSYICRLISSASREALNVNQDYHLETPVNSNPINTWIRPEQALTVGELAELLKNDSLANKEENSTFE